MDRSWSTGRGCALIILASLLGGCASFGEGIARGVMESSDESAADTRMCTVSGPTFSGIQPLLENQAGFPPLSEAGPDRPILKVIMIHGVGTHVPGYAARLSANLAKALDLPVVAPEPKGFPIEAIQFPGVPLGELTVTRHTNAARDREMLFYELTWSPISQPAKDDYAFDETAIYTNQRASLNSVFKHFVNDVAADPLVYTGSGREKIQASVAQALCWALSTDWQGLPDEQAVCRPDNATFGSRLGTDDFVFITHSLGSRITTDALGRLAGLTREQAERFPQLVPVAKAFQQSDVKVFMLANQLPLLQSGLEPAAIRDAVPEYCVPGGEHYQDRLFKQTELIAFSDPNDLLSYPIPDRYLRTHIDSRLCPRQANVTINVAPVSALLGLGEFANPLAAHVDYDNDERVIGLIAGGIGQPETTPVVNERCTWQEVGEDLR